MNVDERSLAPSLVDTVADVLRSFGYRFDASNGDFRFHVVTVPKTSWRSQIVLNAEVLELTIYLTDSLYRPQEQPFILELVCRLNKAASILGSWQMDYDTGSVEYHVGVDLRGHLDPKQSVERALNSAGFPIRLWSRCFDRRGTGASASDIVNAAMIELDCNDYQIVSNSTRRVLLKVLKGGEAKRVSPALDAETVRCLELVASELTGD